ncbi:azurin [bacterium A37T11]|nr:azurin [bacterium A37T11]
MKKLFLAPALAVALYLVACGGGNSNSNSSADSTQTTETQSAAPAEQTPDIPGLDTVAVSNTISLTANDQMKYDKTLFKVKAGESVKLTFKNAGSLPKEAMGHNVVILIPNTDLAAVAGEAIKAKAEDYIPATFASSIVAHTKLLGPGETDNIEFTLKDKGAYEFMCSFPGHYGVMQGHIVAE